MAGSGGKATARKPRRKKESPEDVAPDAGGSSPHSPSSRRSLDTTSFCVQEGHGKQGALLRSAQSEWQIALSNLERT
jgi:hypothetical protein